jgi:HlyD family secretion protein
MGSNWTRALPLASIILALVGAVGWALWPQPIPVDVGMVVRGPMEVTVEDEGIARVRELYTVSSPVLGKLRRPHIKVGDGAVKDRTVVALIEPVDPSFLDLRSQQVQDAVIEAARAAVDLADAQLRQAKAQAEFARTELERTRTLMARQTTSERSLDQARLNLATAEAAVASAAANLDLRRHEFEQAEASRIQPGASPLRRAPCCVEIAAPASGRVLRILVESEQVVQSGQPLLEIGDTQDLEIAVDLVSRDAVRVVQGAAARLENWGGEGALQARVARIEPLGFTKISALGIEEQRVRVILDLTESRERYGRLGHGFRVIARVSVWRAEDIVRIPLGALFRQGENWATYVVTEGRATLRLLGIGERNLREAQIVSGLSPGEKIVLHPSDRLFDGARVTAR